MRFVLHLCLAFLATAALPAQAAQAGMPSSFVILSDMARMRLQKISFFLMGLLLCSGFVRFLWNYLQRDFPTLPRLTFRMAGVLVLVWGLLSIVVLTMISGARELMTPGAWKTQGVTYRLATAADKSVEQVSDAPVPQTGLLVTRRRHLERLRNDLWDFAGKHNGQFPQSLSDLSIAPQDQQLPESEGMPYSYIGGLAKDKSDAVLVFEPRIYGDDQFALRANGEVVRLTSDAIRAALDERANAVRSEP